MSKGFFEDEKSELKEIKESVAKWWRENREPITETVTAISSQLGKGLQGLKKQINQLTKEKNEQ